MEGRKDVGGVMWGKGGMEEKRVEKRRRGRRVGKDREEGEKRG